MHKSKENGFTLIELLIVIAIVAILASVAVFQFAEYQARALQAGMMTDARNLATVMESVFSDCQDYRGGLANVAVGPSVVTVLGNQGACVANPINQTARVSAGNTPTLAGLSANTYLAGASNPNARAGRQNVTIDQAGNITWQ